MLNVNDLELRHKRYKKNSSYLYLIIIALVVIILMSIIFFALYNENIEIKAENTKQEASEVKEIEIKNIEPIIKEIKPKEQPIVQEEIQNIEKNSSEEEKSEPISEIKKIEQNRVILTPSLNFIDKISSNNNVKHQTIIVSEVKEIEIKNIEPIIKEVKPKEQPIVQEEIQNIEKNTLHVEDKKSSINIERKDEEDDIADVIKRFNINHNPALSLFIAKKYYQLGNYEQAYNYALMTNDINNNIEGSWIIFSKSLVKLSKKELAVETLKKYISYSNSSQAKQLLDEITSGKFK